MFFHHLLIDFAVVFYFSIPVYVFWLEMKSDSIYKNEIKHHENVFYLDASAHLILILQYAQLRQLQNMTI